MITPIALQEVPKAGGTAIHADQVGSNHATEVWWFMESSHGIAAYTSAKVCDMDLL